MRVGWAISMTQIELFDDSDKIRDGMKDLLSFAFGFRYRQQSTNNSTLENFPQNI